MRTSVQVEIVRSFDHERSSPRHKNRLENLCRVRALAKCTRCSTAIDESPRSNVLEYVAVQIWVHQPILIGEPSTVIECECWGEGVCEIVVDPWCYDQVDAVELCFHVESGSDLMEEESSQDRWLNPELLGIYRSALVVSQ